MKPIKLLILCTLVLVVIGCKKHDENQCVEINQGSLNLSPQEKLIHPYGIDDSLVFMNEKDQSLLSYTCTAQSSGYYVQSENQPNSQGITECLGNYYFQEYAITRFGSYPDKFINIQLIAPSLFDSRHKENGLQIGIGIPGKTIYPFDGMFAFKTDTLFTYPAFPYSNVEGFYDTLTIGDNLYRKVYLLKGLSGSGNMEKIIKIYYSVTDGILKLITNEDNNWVLLKRYTLR
jgi:hypothetical protein